MAFLFATAATILACHDANPDPKAPSSPVATAETRASLPGATNMMPFEATSNTTTGSLPLTPPLPLEQPASDANGRPEADDTRVNTPDRGGAAEAPMSQGNGATDRKITQAIRRAIAADEALSLTSKNVKVITSGGKVLLSGVVRSERERASIEAKAHATAGVIDIDDELEVKP
jgi:hypothetical protein